MRRREFLTLSPLALACGEAMPSKGLPFGQPPWHMWGTSQNVSIPNVAAGPQFQSSNQLARVNYGRPETWSFFFAAELIKAPTPNAGNLLVIVEYELIIGLGRSNVSVNSTNNGQRQGFARFVWAIGVTGPVFPANLKWTSTTQTPVLDEGAVTPRTETVSWFPAQDIQCSAKTTVITAAGVVADPETKLIVHAYFAPRTHLRPEWNLDDPKDQFRGTEQAGT